MTQINKDLTLIDNITAIDVFNTVGGLDPFIKETRNIVENFKHDMSTASSRKKTASLSAKVSKLKVSFDNMGKELTAEWKEKSKRVDQSRKSMRDELDSLRDEARMPLTEWEDKEKEKQAVCEEKYNELVDLSNLTKDGFVLNIDDLKNNLELIKNTIIDDGYGEFEFQAIKIQSNAKDSLSLKINELTDLEKQRVELENLRKEKEERDRIDYENKLKEEAAKEAKEQADREASEKQAKIEQEKQEAINKEKKANEEKEQAIRDKIEAEERAKIQSKLAEEKRIDDIEKAKKEAEEKADKKALDIENARIAEEEKTRIEAEKQKAIEEKKAANKKHQASINNSILKEFLSIGMNEDQANSLIKAIAKNEIEFLTINY